MTEQELIANLRAVDNPLLEQRLFDALITEHGFEKATAMWDGALAEIDHTAAITDAVASLTDLLNAVQKDLNTADHELDRLTTGNAYHVEYQGTGAEDIRQHLDDAARAVRAAAAIHHSIGVTTGQVTS